MLELRPMSIGELLDAMFGVYRSAFVVMASVVIICQGLPTILYTYVLLAGGPFVQPELFAVSLLFSGLGATVSGAAIIYVVSATILGNSIDVWIALRAALRAFLPLFVAGLARLLLVLLGALFFILPGVIVALGYVLVEQVIMLERPARAVDALPRSWTLTRDFKGKALGLGLVVLVFVQLIPAIGAGAFTALMPSLEAEMQIGTSLLQLVLFPMIPITFTLLYYDLRIRKEAFDLEFLSTQMELAEAPARS